MPWLRCVALREWVEIVVTWIAMYTAGTQGGVGGMEQRRREDTHNHVSIIRWVFSSLSFVVSSLILITPLSLLSPPSYKVLPLLVESMKWNERNVVLIIIIIIIIIVVVCLLVVAIITNLL